LADILARKLQIGSGGDPYIHEINLFAMEELDIEAEDMDSLIETIGEKIQESADLLALVQ